MVTQADIVSRLHRASSLRTGDILDALTRTRFFGGSPDPEITLAVREALFAADYPDRGRHDIGVPCRVKAPGYDNARALLVDREALHEAQEDNDVMLAFRTLRTAYETDVGPLLARARAEQGGAIDWLRTYRDSRYRERKAQERKAVGLGAGIV